MSLTHEPAGLKILEKIKIYILSRAKLLCSLCHEIPCSKDSLTILPLQTFFCLKYMEFFCKARLYNGIHRRKYCSVCLQKPKQQIANANSLIYKYCICVCRKCERFSSNCDACKFTISTHFR